MTHFGCCMLQPQKHEHSCINFGQLYFALYFLHRGGAGIDSVHLNVCNLSIMFMCEIPLCSPLKQVFVWPRSLLFAGCGNRNYKQCSKYDLITAIIFFFLSMQKMLKIQILLCFCCSMLIALCNYFNFLRNCQRCQAVSSNNTINFALFIPWKKKNGKKKVYSVNDFKKKEKLSLRSKRVTCEDIIF